MNKSLGKSRQIHLSMSKEKDRKKRSNSEITDSGIGCKNNVPIVDYRHKSSFAQVETRHERGKDLFLGEA